MEDKRKNIKVCEICKNDANCLCFQCISYFCDSCYKFVHDKKTNEQHKKENIDSYFQLKQNVLIILKIELIYFVLMKKVKISFYLMIIFKHSSLLLSLLFFEGSSGT